MHAKSLQSCLTLSDRMDYSLLGSSVHGILQARILEWVSISFSRDLPDPGFEPTSPALGGILYQLNYQGYSATKFAAVFLWFIFP